MKLLRSFLDLLAQNLQEWDLKSEFTLFPQMILIFRQVREPLT